MEVFVIEVVIIAVVLVLFLAPGVVVLPPHPYAFGLLLLAPLLTSTLKVHHTGGSSGRPFQQCQGARYSVVLH